MVRRNIPLLACRRLQLILILSISIDAEIDVEVEEDEEEEEIKPILTNRKNLKIEQPKFAIEFDTGEVSHSLS